MENTGRTPETDTMVQERKVTDMLRRLSGASRRAGGWRRAAGTAGCALAILFLVVWTGCKNPLNVENPNKLTEENVNSPSAYGALVGGARNNLARAAGGMLPIVENATDESFWIGSRDAWGALDQGNIGAVTNEFTDRAWPYAGQARYMVDKAVILGEQYQSDGTLPDKDLLARAYLYAGTMYTLLGDTWQRFVLPQDLTDPTTPGSPIAVGDMPNAMYGQAMTYFGKGLGLNPSSDIKTQLLAMTARAMQAKLIREHNQGGSPTANNGIVGTSDGSLAQAAQDALNAIGGDDGWTFALDFSNGLLGIGCQSWAPQVWSRGELQLGDRPLPNNSYVYLSNSSKTVDSVKLEDPIDNIIDPVFSAAYTQFKAAGENAPLVEMSARELHLIIAEDALFRNDTTTFAAQINYVRDLDGLTHWDPNAPQMTASKILEWERNVNLVWQGRRLADLYRFGDVDPLWLSNSVAVTSPGTLFPITITEIRSNPNVSG